MPDTPDKALPAAVQEFLHRSGSAWTDRGSQGLVSGRAGDWEESVRCHRRAVELLGRLPLTENVAYIADLGAAWVNLGCSLQTGPSRESLPEAMDAFDRAVELLERLPLGSNPRFRHNLAAAWMNRADALSRIDTDSGRERALEAYGRAIGIAGDLPLDEKPSFRVLLGSCWINLGTLHQRMARNPEAVRAFDKAIAALGPLAESGHRLACHHAATSWTNRGEALLNMPSGGGAEKAVDSARTALRQIEGRDIGGPVDAKLSLRALRVLARGLEALARSGIRAFESVAELTDVAERGIERALAGRTSEPEFFDPFVLWFFSFGSRTYGQHQPQFLAELLAEVLGRWDFAGSPAVGDEMRRLARLATSGAIERLGRGRILVAGAPQTERLLGTVRELRHASAQF
jgi:tetratricopeptide (TPR) repeat protein